MISFTVFLFFLYHFGIITEQTITSNIVKIKIKYCKHRTSTKAHIARRGQETPIQAALIAFTPPPLTSQSPSACGQTPEPPCLRREHPASS